MGASAVPCLSTGEHVQSVPHFCALSLLHILLRIRVHQRRMHISAHRVIKSVWTERQRACPQAAAVAACFVLTVLSVLLGVYMFVGLFNGMYLIHTASGITMVCIAAWCTTLQQEVWMLAASAAGYALVRHFTQPDWRWIIIISAWSALEQWLGGRVLRKYSAVYGTPTVQSLALTAAVCAMGSVLSVASSLTLHYVLHKALPKLVLVYIWSHFAGTFVTLHSWHTYRLETISKGFWSKFYVAALAGVVVATGLLNSWKNYSYSSWMVSIATVPLAVLMSTCFGAFQAWIGHLGIMAMVFVTVCFGRGPFVESDQDVFSTVCGLFTQFLVLSLTSTTVSMLKIQWQMVTLKLKELHEELLFMSNQVGHDVRTPLLHVLSIAEGIAASGYCSSSDSSELQTSVQIVTDVLDSWLLAMRASANGGEVAPACTKGVFSVRSLLQSIATYGNRCIILQNKHNWLQPLQIDVADSVPVQVLQAGSLVRYILMNLVSNAVKYSDAGCIVVKVEWLESKQETWLKLTVKDQGKGIAPENIEHLFKHGYRVSQSQSCSSDLTSHGIGLYLVNTMVQRLQGTISVESVMGAGSTFTVQLPAKQCSASPPPSVCAAPDLECEHRSILIVDDDPLCRKLIARMLQKCDCTQAGTAAAAIALLDAAVPDVVLLDGILPDIKGRVVLQHIRNTYPTLPVIVISGDCSLLADTTLIADPYTLFCPKPFTRSQLQQALAGALNIA